MDRALTFSDGMLDSRLAVGESRLDCSTRPRSSTDMPLGRLPSSLSLT
jgi:hypothetical protein